MKTKKEIKDEYKQKTFRMGVFQIRNTESNKVFIGSSTDLDAIWNRMRMELKFGSHPNKALQQDWNTMGENLFVYEVVKELAEKESEQSDYKKKIKALEEGFIAQTQPNYNNQSITVAHSK